MNANINNRHVYNSLKYCRSASYFCNMVKHSYLIILLIMAQSCVVSKTKYDKQAALVQKLSAQKDDCIKSLEIAELALDTMELKLANKLNYIEFLRTDSSSKEQRIAKLGTSCNDRSICILTPFPAFWGIDSIVFNFLWIMVTSLYYIRCIIPHFYET